MKDFYDIWILATAYTFEVKTLKDAISSTFRRRATPLPVKTPLALTREFAEDSTKKTQWTAFLRKGKLLEIEPLALNQIAPIIEKLIMPVLVAETVLVWNPNTLEWTDAVETVGSS